MYIHMYTHIFKIEIYYMFHCAICFLSLKDILQKFLHAIDFFSKTQFFVFLFYFCLFLRMHGFLLYGFTIYT